MIASPGTPSSGGGSSSLRKVQDYLAATKPRIVRFSLITLCLLGVVAQLVQPVGDALSKKNFLGGSFAAFIALILFDAITGDKPRSDSGQRVLGSIEELQECASRAFEERDVRIDFFGFTSETLFNVVASSMLRMVGESRGRRRVRFRILVPDLKSPIGLPCRLIPLGAVDVEGGQSYRMVDDPDFRNEMQRIIDDSVRKFEELKRRIENSAPGVRVEISVRIASHLAPQTKLLIFNDEEACQGYYPVEEEDFPVRNESPHRILNPKGFAAGGMVLVSKRGGSPTVREMYEQHRRWFEHHWSLVEQTQ